MKKWSAYKVLTIIYNIKISIILNIIHIIVKIKFKKIEIYIQQNI